MMLDRCLTAEGRLEDVLSRDHSLSIEVTPEPTKLHLHLHLRSPLMHQIWGILSTYLVAQGGLHMSCLTLVMTEAETLKCGNEGPIMAPPIRKVFHFTQKWKLTVNQSGLACGEYD